MSTVIKTICVSPVCTNYIKTCTYSTITLTAGVLPDSSVTITINGIVNVTLLTSPPTIAKLIFWLNSLGLGFFTYTLTGNDCTIEVYGNSTYGGIGVGKTIVLTPTCNTITTPPCDLCLPQPEPEAPVVLNTRFVKPGYSTPFCSPEYTERVNCNYGDQLYNKMLSARYGLTVCCDESFDKWLIKKELLDLDSIRNTEFNCCPPVPVCNTCNSQACDCPIVYPDCYCWSFTLGADCLVQTVCKGVTETKLYITGLHHVCSELKPVTDPTCGEVIDPIYLGPCSDTNPCITPEPVITNCWSIAGLGGFTVVTYETDQEIPVSVQGGFVILQVCSSTIPTTTGKIPPFLIGSCDDSCGIPPDPIEGCKCFRIVVSTNNANIAEVTIEYADCNEVYTSVVQTSAIADLYICSSITPIVLSGTSNASVAMIANNPIDCINDPGSCGPLL